MKKNSHDKISETLVGIEFFRSLKTQAPQGNELVLGQIEKIEKELMERLFQLSRQERAPAMNEQPLPSKRKSKGKEVIENGNDPRRTD